MRIDDYGRVILDEEELFDLLHAGGKISEVLTEAHIPQFDAMCERFGHPEYNLQRPAALPHSPEVEHAERTSRWMIPDELHSVDVRVFLLTLCDSEAERARINEEMDLYEERGLLPVLRLMVYLVDHFRTNKIVWGVGRGSSVASYVLFKIGVHKIDSMKYGLSIKEFLK